jgi:N-methylhydantoinase A
VLTPLDADTVHQAARVFARHGVEAIAVSLLWSIVNPTHEKEAREILARELPNLPVVLSSDILPAIREWERTCATVLSAYILPGISRYMTELESYLRENGLRRPLLIIQLNGGCSSVSNVLRKPINALASGPAAGPAAALHCTAREGADDIIAIDMGGTSFEVCLISGGRPSVTKEMRVEQMPVGVSAVDVHSIGAGGGSVAWVDKGGALHVGPRSAGALPGPACYGLGGDLPTVTDANLVLGYINPDYFLGGRRKIDPELSRKAITRHVVEPLGVSLEEAASGIFRLVNHNMVSAIRAVSIERGIDPRRYVMVVGGGAGAIHGTSLAAELGISKLLIPSYAGVLCSYGMVVSDVKHDYLKTLACNSDKFDFAAVNNILDHLEQQAREDLIAEGFTPDRIEVRRFSDAKYPSQVHELTIPIAAGRIGPKELTQALEEFHSLHERMFTYCVRESPVNFFHWGVSGLGKTSGVVTESLKSRPLSAHAAIKESRKIYLPDRGYVTTERYDAAKLVSGMTIDGPAVVEQVNTTVLLLEGQRLEVNAYGDFVVQLQAASSAAFRGQ